MRTCLWTPTSRTATGMQVGSQHPECALRHASLHMARPPSDLNDTCPHADGGLASSCVLSLRVSLTMQASTQGHPAHSHRCTTQGRCASPTGSTPRHRCASPTATTLWGPCEWPSGRTCPACMRPLPRTWAAWMQASLRGRPAHRGGTLTASPPPSPATATASLPTSSLRQVRARLCSTLCCHHSNAPQDT